MPIKSVCCPECGADIIIHVVEPDREFDEMGFTTRQFTGGDEEDDDGD